MDNPVMTVLGPVAATALGRTLVHEHCLIDLLSYWSAPSDPGRLADAQAPLDITRIGTCRRNPFFHRDNLILDDIEVAVRELAEFGKLGGRTVVDLTPPDIGRDPAALQRIARSTGLNVIAGCGHYIRISHPPGLEDESVGSIADRLVGEILVGIDGTGVRAGVIGELGTSNPIHPTEAKVLRAAAAAHAATGVAIVVHLSPPPKGSWWLGEEVLDILEAEGVDPRRVLLGHLDNALSPDAGFERAVTYHLSLARRGCFIGYDGCGKDHYFPSGSRASFPNFWCPSDRERALAVARLADAGFAEQVLLSQDVCFKAELVSNGGFGYGHIVRTFASNLEDAGLGTVDLERLMVDNPRRFLATGR